MIIASTHRHTIAPRHPSATAVCASITLSKCQTPTRTRLPRRSPSTRCVRVMTIHFPSRARCRLITSSPKTFFLGGGGGGHYYYYYYYCRVTNCSSPACRTFPLPSRTPCRPPLPSCPSERSDAVFVSCIAGQGGCHRQPQARENVRSPSHTSPKHHRLS